MAANILIVDDEQAIAGICQTFREKLAKYGFIERYPAGREQLTHIAHEPWHFRYVGYPHSELMREKELTLERKKASITGLAVSFALLLIEGLIPHESQVQRQDSRTCLTMKSSGRLPNSYDLIKPKVRKRREDL